MCLYENTYKKYHCDKKLKFNALSKLQLYFTIGKYLRMQKRKQIVVYMCILYQCRRVKKSR